jgi:type I restriction enzyme M protein
MLKSFDAREYVMSVVYNSFDKLRGKGYYQEEIFIILLALYAYKTKEQDDIKRELMESTFRIVGEDADALVEISEQLQKVDYEEYMKVYPSIVDEVVEHVFLNNGRASGEFITPKTLSSLLGELVKQNQISSVFNPFARLASIPISLGNIPCYSQEINQGVHAIGMVLLDAHGYDINNYSLNDVLHEWNPMHAECLVSIPPFSVTFQKETKKVPVRTYEEYLLWKFLEGEERYAYIVVINGFCSNQNRTTLNLRKSVIEGNYLDKVISLPAGIFANTGIPTTLLVLNKERKENMPIEFFDAHNLFVTKNKREKNLDVDAILNMIDHPAPEVSAFIYKEDICHNDYRWDVESYLSRKLEVFPEGYEVVELNEIVEPISLNRHFSDTTGHFVKIAQMSNDVEGYNRTPDSFELSNDIQKCSKLEEPALLLSTIGLLKPTYCAASVENPVFLHPHVRAFRIIAQWVNPAYLCLQLVKSKGYAVGAFVPHINVKDILRIRIAFPSLDTQQSFDEQGRLYQESIESAKLAKAKELGLHEVIGKMKSDYMDEVRNRKHDMKTPMAQLRNTLTLLKALAKELPEESSKKLQTYIERQKTSLDVLSEIVSHLADEEVFSAPEALDIDAVLSSLVVTNELYTIKYQRDEMALHETGNSKPVVMIGKSDFMRLVNNIVSNAVKHGFVDKTKHYEMFVTLSVEDGFYLIDFTNNGKPLPEGMDKARYGMKGVKGKDSTGQGRGGSTVKSITEHYGGDYDVFTRGFGDTILTDVIVKLPIYQVDE